MKDLNKMNRNEMEIEIIKNNILTDLNKALKMTDEEMRSLIYQWILKGSEVS